MVKCDDIAMLVASGMMMASVGGTTFGLSGEQTATITASVGTYLVIDGVDDIPLRQLTATNDGYTGFATDVFCVASNKTGPIDIGNSPVTVISDEKITDTVDAELVQGGVYNLTASAGKLTKMARDGSDQLDVLRYSLTLSEVSGAHSWTNAGDSYSSCNTMNHRIIITVNDEDKAQRAGDYVGEVVVGISPYVYTP